MPPPPGVDCTYVVANGLKARLWSGRWRATPYGLLKWFGCCVALLASGLVSAQESSDPVADAGVPTLERVEALPPEEEVLDLYRFDNPVEVPPDPFAQAYKPDPTVEEIALEHGGLINYGINLALLQSWRGIKKVTGMRPQTQAVTARPPPLDEAQLRRAAALCAEAGNDCGNE